MLSHNKQDIDGYDGIILSLYSRDEILSFSDVLDLWVDDEAFRDYFIDLLKNLPYSAIRWETPALTSRSADRPFECVVLNSPGLDRSADDTTFTDLFDRMEQGGVGAFPNLGGDAIMILPGPVNAGSSYSHLLSFVNTAPGSQLHSFWQLVGDSVKRRLGERPLWLNTAGGGVSWLHVRLDDRPKYYVYDPYRETPPSSLRR